MQPLGEKKQNPYSIIAKCDNGNGTSSIVKYKYVSDLLAIWNYMASRCKAVLWMNVYSRANGNQLASFTKNYPPTKRKL